jgi:hypothetical protein
MAHKKTVPATSKVDIITPEDMRLFKDAKKNVNVFTDFYMRSETSGTRWMHQVDPPDPDKVAAWMVLWDAWNKAGKPKDIFAFGPAGQETVYMIEWDDNKEPVFWQPHGWITQPWQLEVMHARQSDTVIVGGFGTGKTAMIAMLLAVNAAMTPGFRGFSIAPQMSQSMEVYNYLTTNYENTPFWKRWVVAAPKAPFPSIVLQNSYIGESTISFYSLEKNTEKIRTVEGDMVVVDQAEAFTDNLMDLRRDAGSRLRGHFQGRPRLNRMVYIANAGDNPDLWYLYDMQKQDPVNYMSRTIKTRDNPYLTNHDIERFKDRVGGDAKSVQQWMDGVRPHGKGEQFSGDTVEKCTDLGLNAIMDRQLGLPDNHPNKQHGFITETEEIVGVFHWEMPPDFEGMRQYIVIGDPGQANPPARNSPAIMVWDITDFPKAPATMRAMHWVFGEGSYYPFMFEFERMVNLYRAHTRCAFDSTGVQKGFDELVFNAMGLMAEGMDMAVGGKMRCLNAAKVFTSRRMMLFPHIPHLSNQLTHYKLPDEKIRQDLVSAFIMSAGYMNRYFYEDKAGQEKSKPVESSFDRHQRSISDRHARNGVR